MAQRQIGQEQLWGERPARRGGASLEEVAALVDWTAGPATRRHLGICQGRAWLATHGTLFRALLLATWHDLSDVRLAESLDDPPVSAGLRLVDARAHAGAHRFVRFRGELVRLELDRALFAAVTRQLTGVALWCGRAPW